MACSTKHSWGQPIIYSGPGSIDFNITYKKGGFKLTAFSDANWGNNPDNGFFFKCNFGV